MCFDQNIETGEATMTMTQETENLLNHREKLHLNLRDADSFEFAELVDWLVEEDQHGNNWLDELQRLHEAVALRKRTQQERKLQALQEHESTR
jgi:hypothetical protein